MIMAPLLLEARGFIEKMWYMDPDDYPLFKESFLHESNERTEAHLGPIKK